MTISNILKAAAAFALAAGLSGCFDASFDITVNDTETATLTSAFTVPREMVSLEEITSGEFDLCSDHDEIVEGETTITCSQTTTGPFDELFDDSEEGEPVPTLTKTGPDTVRVSFPLSSFSEDMGADGDPQMRDMILQAFEGKTLSMRVSGGTITDTNMTLVDGGKAAELEASFVDLITGEAGLPGEAYAVVKLD